jgi:hypothetical protein
MNCISCDYEHSEPFCPKCGEKADTKRISLASMLEEAVSTITNMDRGFLFNIKGLIRKPNKIITSYIEGKRKDIFNPLSFFLISITLYILVITSINSILNMELKGGKYMFKHLNYFWGGSILYLGLSTKIIFGKFNFGEHLTIASFILGLTTITGTLTYYIYQNPLMFDPFIYLILIYLLFNVFKYDDNKGIILLKSFFAIILFFIILFCISYGVIQLLEHFNIISQ